METETNKKDYRICARCIMDTSDPDIIFDEEGVCNHCHYFDTAVKPKWFPNDQGKEMLLTIVEQIRNEGAKQEYDSILGLSGGADSSYLAYQTKKLGLRPLVVHVDAGWNSELAQNNIENIVKILGFELFTYVVDWEEMLDLQVAFLRSGLANQDIPQDHAFVAKLYEFAVKNKIKYVLSGGNYATESILPLSWAYYNTDLKHLKSIHKIFGKRRLKTFPTVNYFKSFIYYPRVKGMKVITPLNYMPYDRKEAIKLLEHELKWKDYGKKHYESRFTKFFQGFFLPMKFGYDKRRAHLSSMILSGQMTRDAALLEMEHEVYSPSQAREDMVFVAKKLGLTYEEFDVLLHLPNTTYKDYPSNKWLFEFTRELMRLLKS
jgi:N-acetyl sugar amidotransferase